MNRAETSGGERAHRRMLRGACGGLVCALVLLLLSTAGLRGQEYPTFQLLVSPCPQTVEIGVGGLVELEIDLVLRTVDNPEPGFGATGWSIGVGAEGVEFTDITTQGTVAAEVADDPPGLRQGGFEISELGVDGSEDCEGLSSAISAVVLSFLDPVTIPPEGPVVIARATVEAVAPAEPGTTAPVSIRYVDGCRGSGCCVDNIITWEWMSTIPELGRCDFELVAVSDQFLRGDANGDGRVDLADALAIFGCKFSGGECPTCRDAADSNDDGSLDVSDGVHILGFLFSGGEPPPPPGSESCGPDPTDDALPDCDYSSCPDV